MIPCRAIHRVVSEMEDMCLSLQVKTEPWSEKTTTWKRIPSVWESMIYNNLGLAFLMHMGRKRGGGIFGQTGNT